MSFDNRQFNVNGQGEEMLGRALALAFEQSDVGVGMAKAWKRDDEHGLILLWSASHGTAFPSPMDAQDVLPMVMAFLKEQKETPTVKCEGWDANADHDGSNSLGWRVHCGDWGHVGSCHYSICAVKPVYLWHGK
jgi:hypothetical protein